MPHTHMLQVIRKTAHWHMSSFPASICGTSMNCHGHLTRYKSQALQQVYIVMPLGTPFAITCSQEYKQCPKHSAYLSSWQVSECNSILHISKMDIQHNQLELSLYTGYLIHLITADITLKKHELGIDDRTGWNAMCYSCTSQSRVSAQWSNCKQMTMMM